MLKVNMYKWLFLLLKVPCQMVWPGKAPSLIIKLLNEVIWLSTCVDYDRLKQDLVGCLEQHKNLVWWGGARLGGTKLWVGCKQSPDPTGVPAATSQQFQLHIPIFGKGHCKGIKQPPLNSCPVYTRT